MTLDKQNTYYTYSICFLCGTEYYTYSILLTGMCVFLYLRTMLPFVKIIAVTKIPQSYHPLSLYEIVKMCCSDITNIGCNTHRYVLSVYHSPSPQKRKKRALDEYPLSLLAIIPLTSSSFFTPTPNLSLSQQLYDPIEITHVKSTTSFLSFDEEYSHSLHPTTHLLPRWLASQPAS